MLSFNELGFQLFNQSVPLGAENYVFSPLSVVFALCVLANGAQDATQNEILGSLHIPETNTHRLNVQMKKLHSSISSPPTGLTIFEIANAVMTNPSLGAIKQDFREKVEFNYNAKFFHLGPNVKDQVNNWVAAATKNKIQNFLKDDPGNIEAIILNAIYFKGTWATLFDKDATQKLAFYVNPSQSVDVMMMTQTSRMTHYDHPFFDAVDLHYYAEMGKSNLVGTFILPKGKYNLKEAGEAVFRDYDKWTTTGQKEVLVHITVPKFKIEKEKELSHNLRKLGIKSAFQPSANFSPMAENSKGLFVSQVLHRSLVEISEEGTEAAAVSAVMMLRSAQRTNIFNIFFDRPFLFMIRDVESGAVVFIVQIVNPLSA